MGLIKYDRHSTNSLRGCKGYNQNTDWSDCYSDEGVRDPLKETRNRARRKRFQKRTMARNRRRALKASTWNDLY